MITDKEIRRVGKINKTHGVDGEMSVSFYDDDAYQTIEDDSCLIMNIDGINVPFFVDGVRPKGAEALLLHIDGIDTQEEAAEYVGHDVWMLVRDLPDDSYDEPEDDTEGLYAEQLIGYKAYSVTGEYLGEISDYDDSTDNPLFIIDTTVKPLLIPMADDFISEISTHNKTITFDLPEGLLQL